MKKTFVIQVEYPDCDFVSSEEVMEVTQECIELYMERHFGANIMDGDYDRIKVKEVTGFIELIKKMREAQAEREILTAEVMYKRDKRIKISDVELDGLASATNMVMALEQEVGKHLKKMEI